MSLFSFFLRTAVHNLRRGGQRVLVAVLCIVFGVMSLTAMNLLANTIRQTLIVDPRLQVGADFSLDRWYEDYLLPEHISQLETFQKQGVIEQLTLVSYSGTLTYRKPGSGEIFFATGLGVDPHQYPLLGSLTVEHPANQGVEALLLTGQDVVVTRDLALENGLAVGDALILADLRIGVPVQAQVRGILSDTPNHAGGKMYYTMDLAQALSGPRPAENLALVLAPGAIGLVEELSSSGWLVYSAPVQSENAAETEELILILLQGAGMLGLMVGGIGIANTMHVLLRRRREELAVWKTLGYEERHLRWLFVIEAVLLGLAGSLPGALLGVLVSVGLVEVFSRVSNLLLAWSFSPAAVSASAAAGVFTTVIFALWAIISACQVQPAVLLRSEPAGPKHLPWRTGLGLALLLSLPFWALASVMMGSAVTGAGVLLFAAVGFLVLGGLLGGAVWLAARLLPLQPFPLAHMAQRRLRRGGLGMVFAMIALFAGIVSLGLGTAFTRSAVQAMEERAVQTVDYPITVMVPPEQAQEAEAALDVLGLRDYRRGVNTSLQSIISPGSEDTSTGGPQIPLILSGRDQPHDLQLHGKPWGEVPEGVYVPQYTDVGDAGQIEVQFWDGTRQTLEVVGTYTVEWSSTRLPQPMGLVMPLAAVERFAPPDTRLYYVHSPDSRVSRAAAALGEALPFAVVVNHMAYAARFTQSNHNLFVLAVAMAGLALLAGVLLVGNSVSLAMLDRKYEIGILKAIGYSRRHIWLALAVEYGLAAVIASLAGVAVVQSFMLFLALSNDLAARLLTLDAGTAGVILLTGVGLTLITVLGATWAPVQAAPLAALNDRE